MEAAFLALRHALLSFAYTTDIPWTSKNYWEKMWSNAVPKAQDLMMKFQELLENLEDSRSAVENSFHQFQDQLILECLDKMKDETPESLACSFG